LDKIFKYYAESSVMHIPIEFSMYRAEEERFYRVCIQIGQRKYRAQISGNSALETIADDILRLTVVAQVQTPEYHMQLQNDNLITPEVERDADRLIALLHDNDRIRSAHQHVRDRMSKYRVRTANSPPSPVYN
jgi:hypothetical protein